MARTARRRRWPVYTVVTLVVLALLWVGGWFAAARFAESALARVTSSPIGGFTIGCPEPVVYGFPFRIDIRCQRVTVSGQGDSLSASLGGVSASAPLYRPCIVEATLDAPLQIDVAPRGLALTATWSAARADASAWLDGLNSGSIHFEALGLTNAGRADALPVTAVKAQVAEVGIAPSGGGNYRMGYFLEKRLNEPVK